MTAVAPFLTDEELDRLDRFSLDRIDEDAVTEGKDEGVIGVSELDGLLTAIVSGPVIVVPSRWLPAVYGDFEPMWEELEDAESILSLLFRHMNGIAYVLIEEPHHFEPIFMESVRGGEPVLIVDEWCEGYLRGVALTADEWSSAGPEIADLLAPIRAFTEETNWLAHELDDPKQVDTLRDAIVPNVRAIHAYWLRLRGADSAPVAPWRRDKPRVGRDDPCPCGSGKKYKSCCLQ
jgi:uncharacterized protein